MHRVCKIAFLFCVRHAKGLPSFVGFFLFWYFGRCPAGSQQKKGRKRWTNLVFRHVIVSDYEKLESHDSRCQVLTRSKRDLPTAQSNINRPKRWSAIIFWSDFCAPFFPGRCCISTNIFKWLQQFFLLLYFA